MANRLKEKWSKNKLGFASVLLMAVAGVLIIGKVFAGTGYFESSSSGPDASPDNPVEVVISVSPETGVDGIEAFLSYDTNKLEFVSVNADESAFPLELEQSNAAGEVKIVRGILGNKVNGANSPVATVTFNALGEASSSDVSISGKATSEGEYLEPSSTNLEVQYSSGTE